MAQKRMFTMKIVDSDAFLDMPLSSQCLYFHLNMRADDDGFVGNPKKIMRMVGASEDDLKVLIAKKFLIFFDTGIVVIKHWWMHNTLTKDRYSETSYRDEKNLLNLKENKSYTLDINYSDHPACEKLKKDPVVYSDARIKRIQAIKESDLPTHFNRTISNSFHNERCPVCNVKMDLYDTQTRPTVQHNIPISLGGKHELKNISVICQSCNCSLNNKESPAYNTDEVIKKWERIQNSTECIGNVNTDLDKISIDKISKDNINTQNPDKKTTNTTKKKNPKAELFDRVDSFTQNQELRDILKKYLKFKLTSSKINLEQWDIQLNNLARFANGDIVKAINQVTISYANSYQALVYCNNSSPKKGGAYDVAANHIQSDYDYSNDGGKIEKDGNIGF